MLIKIITIINWLVIAVLAFVVISDMLTPKTGGGEAAGRGYAEYYSLVAKIALVVLVILNLIPYPFAKYATFALIVIPPLIFRLEPIYRNFKIVVRQKMEAAKPIFDDKNLDAIARAALKGDVEQFQKRLEKRPHNLEKDTEFLIFLLLEANSSYKTKEKIQCLRLLFDAGAKLEAIGSGYEEMHFQPAASGNLELLRFLLEKGLDANCRQKSSDRPILFEAIEAYQEPEATVRLLLEFGAKPNVVAVRDPENGPISPLFHAAKWERWGICAALLEHGADPNVKSETGVTFLQLFQEADQIFNGDGYTTRKDFERAKRLMGGKRD